MRDVNCTNFLLPHPYAGRRDLNLICGYEYGSDYIKIELTTGRILKYSYRSAGEKHVEMMKKLAFEGEGLEEYVTRLKLK